MESADVAAPGFEELAAAFERIIRRVEQIDVRVPEDSALIGLASDLVPRITHMLRDGIDVLEQVEAAYDPSPDDLPEVPDDDLFGIGLQISAELASRDLRDVAYFARADLRSALDALVQISTRRNGFIAMASLCESGLRKLRKGLVSVESALYEFEGQAAPERQWFDVQVSLQIRRLYRNLRRETHQRDVSASAGALEDGLRAVLYRIVAFRELTIYPFLRVDDRVNIRRLVKRILEWLNATRRDAMQGRRLWQDLVGFTEILFQVSYRQELQDWDRDVVEKTWRALFDREDAPRELPDLLHRELETLAGLDDELDALLDADEAPPVEAWRAPLSRLRLQMRGREPDGPRAPIWPL